MNSEPAKTKVNRDRFAGLSPAQQQAALTALTLKKDETTFWSVTRGLLPQAAIWIVIALVLWGIAVVVT
jgi:hypothetical protein